MMNFKYIALRATAVIFATYQIYLFYNYMDSNQFDFSKASSSLLLKFLFSVYILIPNRLFSMSTMISATRVISLGILTLYLLVVPMKMLISGIVSQNLELILFAMAQLFFALTIPVGAFIKYFPKQKIE